MAKKPTKGMFTSPGQASPTTRLPGETDPFDPDGGPVGGPPKSVPSSEPETGGVKPMRDVKDEPETGGIKPMRDVKGDTPAVETPAEMTFTFFRGAERGNASPTSLYGSRDAEQLSQAELREYFEGDTVNRLPEVFGDFNNYLAYMTEREQLIQSGDYDVGNWDEYTGSLSEDDLMILEGEDLTQYGDDANMTYEELYGSRTQNQKSAYNRWVNSEANQALLQKYGVNDTVYSETGDKFQWNGSAYVKTVNEDHAGLTDYVKMAIITAFGAVAGAGISGVISTATGAATAGAGAATVAASNVTSAVLTSAITQAVTTGNVDLDQLLQTAATAGLGQALSQAFSPDVLESLEETLGFDITAVTGIEEVDNVLNAMGMTALRQGVFEGSLDMESIVTSGLVTGAKEIADFLWSSIEQAIAENTFASPEQAQELIDNLGDLKGVLDEKTNEEINRRVQNNVQAALSEQQSEAMTASMQRIADSLNEMYAPEPTPDFSVPGESTVDAAGSEFADTTMSEDEFLETETFQEFEPDEQFITYPEDQVRVVNGVVYSRNPDGSLGEVLSIEEGADTQKVLDQLVTPVTRYGETVSGVSGYDLDSKAVSFLYDELGEEGLNKLLQENGMTLHQSSPGNFIIIDNQTGGIAPSVNLDDLAELGTRKIADIVSPEEQQNNDYVRQTILADAVEAATPGEAPETPLDSSMEFEAEEYEFEPEVIPEPPPEPEPVQPTEQPPLTQAGATPPPTDTENPITTGMFPEYFPEPAPTPAPAHLLQDQ